MAKSEMNQRDGKLIQYLSESFGNERRLETALEAHIGMTTNMPYKKRLREHLKETKRHAREIERRIKQLGGSAATTPSAPSAVTEVTGALLSGTQKAAALARGPLHALRGTGEEERQLKNAKTEYAEEAQEIAAYSSIQKLAELVGDRDTAQLARAILRDEQRMLKFLEKEILRQTGAVVRAEIPAGQRSSSRKASTRARTGSSSTARKASAARTASTRRASGRPTSTKVAAAKRAAGAKRSTASRKAKARG
jgi:ferritin-like metal-binding protein YciE